MAIKTQGIFGKDGKQLEPYKSFKENFLYWFKAYMNNVFTNQSKRLVKDLKLNSKLQIDFNSKNELNEMREVINEMGRNGFKGPKTYFNPIADFYTFLEDNGADSLTDIVSKTVTHYLSNELTNYSYAHKVNIYTAIKGLILYIEENNIHGSNGEPHLFGLTRGIIRAIQKEKKPFAYLDPHTEYYTFLNTIEKKTWHRYSAARNRLILRVLLLSGIRANELIAIKRKDIKLDNDKIEFDIVGKGNKHRTIFIVDAQTVEHCKTVMKENRKAIYLFETYKGKPITDRYLHELVKGTLVTAGIKMKAKNGPHMLRHSCSTWLAVVAKLDIVLIQEFMGHEDISTTRKYTHLNKEVIKGISSKANEIRQIELGRKI